MTCVHCHFELNLYGQQRKKDIGCASRSSRASGGIEQHRASTADTRLRLAGVSSVPIFPIMLWKFVEISIMYYGKFSRSPLPGPSGTLECSTRAGTSTPPRPPPAAVRRAPAARGERASKRADGPTLRSPDETPADDARCRAFPHRRPDRIARAARSD